MTPHSPASSVDSLFDSIDDGAEHLDTAGEYARPAVDDQTPAEIVPASRAPPPIPGLYVFPGLLPPDVANAALRSISDADHFVGGVRDQVMLFTAPPPCPSSLPLHVQALDKALADLLLPLLPPNTHALAFAQPLARQAILNLYPPGEGISPHVDLPGRYADGIVGASLIGGCVMTFTREADGKRHDVYLPPRSVYVMTRDARWDWAHGIAGRTLDVVRADDAGGGSDRGLVTLPRDLRVSVTLRWMKDGGDVLG